MLGSRKALLEERGEQEQEETKIGKKNRAAQSDRRRRVWR